MNRIYLIIILSAISLCAFSQNDRDYVRRGNRYMRDTVYAKAQVEYQKAIEKDNTNATAHYNLGNALMYQNKAEDAMKEYETATKFERNKLRLAQIYHNMGVLLQSAKQFDKAIACYKNSLRNNPQCDETRYNYALCLFQLKKNPSQSDEGQNDKDDQNGQDKQQEQQEQQKQQKENEQKQNQEQQPDPQQMSKENAEQMLKAAMQNEKDTQEKLQKAQQKPRQKYLQKQW